MDRRRTIGLLAVLAVLLGAWLFSLHTGIGVFVAGHRYWLWKASQAESEDALREHLGRVLDASQYGVNQAENYVREIEDRRVRIRLWRALVEMAPNDNWAERYARHLQGES